MYSDVPQGGNKGFSFFVENQSSEPVIVSVTAVKPYI